MCNGTESTVLNRQLGVVLDDRCRKQVDVIKNGGKLAERVSLWKNALVHMNTPVARQMMQTLGMEPAPKTLKVEPCSLEHAGDPCAVCMEPMGYGARVQTLECGSQHRFHHECALQWLKESATCPLCREDVSAQCGHPPLKEPHGPTCSSGPSAVASCAIPIPDTLDDSFDLQVPTLDLQEHLTDAQMAMLFPLDENVADCNPRRCHPANRCDRQPLASVTCLNTRDEEEIHKRQREQDGSSASEQNDAQSKQVCALQAEIRFLRNQVKELGEQMESRIQACVQEHMDKIRTELSEPEVQQRPAKKSRRSPRAPRCCFVCNGTERRRDRGEALGLSLLRRGPR